MPTVRRSGGGVVRTGGAREQRPAIVLRLLPTTRFSQSCLRAQALPAEIRIDFFLLALTADGDYWQGCYAVAVYRDVYLSSAFVALCFPLRPSRCHYAIPSAFRRASRGAHARPGAFGWRTDGRAARSRRPWHRWHNGRARTRGPPRSLRCGARAVPHSLGLLSRVLSPQYCLSC